MCMLEKSNLSIYEVNFLHLPALIRYTCMKNYSFLFFKFIRVHRIKSASIQENKSSQFTENIHVKSRSKRQNLNKSTGSVDQGVKY